ncbi:C6 zinc finger domain protein [Penicillium subrubescens]|uniref:C6 zinc finger domain protein n=1 Tax=Penicillium subrubescens TaxID=1316194 RepID=UPI0025452B7C|nr:C6 zinc finger domain protein [Penicillium subrubescens]KAJ5911667.1 C6 zinc finger domain protein [Penicillium subrubescens]
MTDPRSESSLYPQSSVSQAAILPLTSAAVRAIGACLQCRAKKRKCDKIWPTCGRCSRQYNHCDYPKQALVMDGPGASFLRSLDIGRLNATVPLPVESQPHMPMLIHSFLETFGMDPLPVDSGSLACLLRATWIQQALADPCALHTTLYAASAHLDAFRGAKKSNMTLYHHTIALRLLQERINDPDAVFSESLMACVAPLVFFSALFGDKGASTIHKMALMRMIKAKGGLEDLALGTFLSELITVCVFPIIIP